MFVWTFEYCNSLYIYWDHNFVSATDDCQNKKQAEKMYSSHRTYKKGDLRCLITIWDR